MEALRIVASRAALLLVDVQERLAAAMPPPDRAACERNVEILVELARRLTIPVVVSEQYPKGLGPTVPAVAAAVAGEGISCRRFEKVEFACTEAPAFDPIWRDLGRDQWIVCGLEAHVCVYQTVRGLVERGARVQVPRDAVASRTTDNRNVGLALIERAGGVVTSTEGIVFDALRTAGSEHFKPLSALIRSS